MTTPIFLRLLFLISQVLESILGTLLVSQHIVHRRLSIRDAKICDLGLNSF